MTVSSTRAQAVAEILCKLKRADKVATLTSIANRAGFNPGPGDRTINTCLKTVRRDWSHLQWWRAVADNGQVEEEQQSYLIDAGFETESIDDGTVVIKALAEQLMNWGEPEGSQDDDLPSVARQE
jgi:alkylated DNA nucleotide flippase Atl1